MTTQKEIDVQDLKDKIKVLEQLPGEGEKELVGKYKKELARLEKKENKGKMEEQDTSFELPMTPEEYEKSGSKFAQEGAHLSEMGMPVWDTPGKSIAFPFAIIEEGEDAGKESKISAGISKDAIWKLKEILKSVDVEVAFPGGKPSFDGMACVGKKFLSLWTKHLDKRPAEEGGKGGSYTKATGALHVEAGLVEEESGV